jgi:hypothetical protein
MFLLNFQTLSPLDLLIRSYSSFKESLCDTHDDELGETHRINEEEGSKNSQKVEFIV